MTTDTVTNPTDEDLIFGDIFLSHANADKKFIYEIMDFLVDNGKTCWLDIQNIPKGEDWWRAILKGIDECTLLIYLLTNDSLVSEGCHWELDYAIEQKKRIITIVCNDKGNLGGIDKTRLDNLDEIVNPDGKLVDPHMHWVQLIRYQLLFINEADFDVKKNELIDTVNRDYAYDIDRKNLHLRTLQWESNQRSGGLLSGAELKHFEELLRISVDKEPPLKSEHIEFIRASRNRATRVLQTIVTTSVVVTFVLVFLSLFALNQRAQAVDNAATAVANEQLAENALQNFVMSNSVQTYSIGTSPNEPLVYGLYAWISDAEAGQLYRLNLHDGQPDGTPIPVGIDALAAQSNGRIIWVMNPTRDMVTLIPPDAPDAYVSVDTRYAPQHVLVTDDSIWIVTLRDAQQIDWEDLEIVQRVDIGRDVGFAIDDGEQYIWAIDRRSNSLHRIDRRTGAADSRVFTDEIRSPFYFNDILWLSGREHLRQIDPQTLEEIQSYNLGQSFTAPVIDGDRFWIVLEDSTILEFDPATGETIRQIIPGELTVRFVVPKPERIWVVTSENIVIGYDRGLLREDFVTSVPGTSTIIDLLFVEPFVWTSAPQLDRVLGIEIESGELARNYVECDGPSNPAFDGANLWVSCRNQGVVVRIPAAIHYHGIGEERVADVQELERNSRPHTPIYDGQSWWIVQEVEGVLMRYDPEADDVTATIPLGEYPALPVYNAPYLWINRDQGGIYELLRFDTSSLENQPDISLSFEREVSHLDQFSDRLWVTTFFDEIDADIPDIFTIESGEETASPHNFGVSVLGTTDAQDGTLWMSVGNFENGALVQVDARTLRVLNTLTLDHTSWRPLVTEDAIWVGGVFEGGLINVPDCFNVGGCDGALYRFDRHTHALDFQIPFEESVSQPIIGGDYIWITFSSSLPIITAPYTRNQHNLTVIDPATGEMVMIFDDICENLLPPLYDEDFNYMWITCIGIGSDPGRVVVLDAETLNPVQDYSDLGREAWPPVQHGDYLWMVYRDTNNLVVFRRSDGEIVRHIGVGDAPGPPAFSDDGSIWIANSREATIQHIDFRE